MFSAVFAASATMSRPRTKDSPKTATAIWITYRKPTIRAADRCSGVIAEARESAPMFRVIGSLVSQRHGRRDPGGSSGGHVSRQHRREDHRRHDDEVDRQVDAAGIEQHGI